MKHRLSINGLNIKMDNNPISVAHLCYWGICDNRNFLNTLHRTRFEFHICPVVFNDFHQAGIGHFSKLTVYLSIQLLLITTTAPIVAAKSDGKIQSTYGKTNHPMLGIVLSQQSRPSGNILCKLRISESFF